MSEGGEARNPSSAGECGACGKHAEKLYGGMGRYVAMCIDCWRDDEPGEARNHEVERLNVVTEWLAHGPMLTEGYKQCRDAALDLLDALRRSPQKRKGHDPGCDLPSAHRGPCRRSPQGDMSAEERIEMLIRERDHAWAIVESFQRSPQGEDHEAQDHRSLTARIADELRHYDERGLGPLLDDEYMDYAAALLSIVDEYQRKNVAEVS